jgi:hypothetical protein
MNSLNDALQRTYNTNVTEGKQLFTEALADPNSSEKSEQQEVYNSLQQMYPGLSFNDAMQLYLNNGGSWAGVLIYNEVLDCTKVIRC